MFCLCSLGSSVIIAYSFPSIVRCWELRRLTRRSDMTWVSASNSVDSQHFYTQVLTTLGANINNDKEKIV